MLTFRFTGAAGQMTEAETLVSGMVGKQVRFEFSSEWDGLRKAAVYRAGDICCTSLDVQEVDTIPALVLSRSLRRLYVGVYGMSEDGEVVLPAVYAPGPFIRIGAAVEDGSGMDQEDPFWIRIEEALAETVRFTPQTLTEQQQAQARANIGASDGGMTDAAAALLLTILRRGVYTEDMSGLIADLEAALAEDTEEAAVWYALTCQLEHVTAEPSSAVIAQGESCTVTLTAEEDYVLDTVTVTMGGEDITAEAYSGGAVSIGAVTGDVVITATAVAVEQEEPGMVYVAGTVYTVEGVPTFVPGNADNGDRISLITTEVTADTPFPVSGTWDGGDVYLITVPETAGVMTVTCPGFVGGAQFFTLADGVYTRSLDAGWVAEDSYSCTITPGAHQYVVINFKKADASYFAMADVDFSGFGVTFEEAEEEQTPVTYPVTLSFTRVSATNNQRTVTEGEDYNTILVADDGCTLSVVTVTMGGVDVTSTAWSGKMISISQVTGAVFVTAVAVEDTEETLPQYIAASVFSVDGVYMINILSESSADRLSCVTTEATADTPFPVNGTTDLGDLYLLAVPETASVLNVTSPGFIGGPQFFNLADGTYTRTIDAGWQTLDSFSYTITPGENQYVAINFKKSDASSFVPGDEDTSGFAVEFE